MKFAWPTALGIIIGIGLVAWIDPDTSAGKVVLVFVAMLVSNLIAGLFKAGARERR